MPSNVRSLNMAKNKQRKHLGQDKKHLVNGLEDPARWATIAGHLQLERFLVNVRCSNVLNVGESCRDDASAHDLSTARVAFSHLSKSKMLVRTKKKFFCQVTLFGVWNKNCYCVLKAVQAHDVWVLWSRWGKAILKLSCVVYLNASAKFSANVSLNCAR